MENNTLEDKVWEKLEKKMAIDNFEKIENITKKEKIKMKKYNFKKVSSFCLVALFLASNLYSYATENKNIFTWAFDKLGITQKYEENKIDINESQTSNGYELVLENYGLDKDTLIMTFDLKSEEELEIEYPFIEEADIYFYESIKIIDENNQYDISNNNITKIVEKISNTEYKICELYKIDGTEITENSKLDIKFYLEKLLEGKNGLDYETLGDWNFNIAINNEKLNLNFEEFDVINKETTLETISKTDVNKFMDANGNYFHGDATVKVLKLKNSNIVTKLSVLLDGFYRSNNNYTIEILDNNNNVILDKDIQYIVGGCIQDIIIRNIDMNSKIKINIYQKGYDFDYESTMEKYGHIPEIEETVVAIGSLEIDLSKDLIDDNK